MTDETTQTVTHNTYAHDFGILIPGDTDVSFTHQGGGIMCRQYSMEGTYLPLRHPTLYVQGSPEWRGDGDISAVDLTSDEIPDRDWESFPDWVQKRGHFHSIDEYFYWKNSDEVHWYGPLDLLEELKSWNYDPDASMPHTDRDMTKRWDGLADLWNAIDEQLKFTYDEYDYYEKRLEASLNDRDIEHPMSDEYPSPDEGIKWITITGSKRYKGRTQAPWAEQLAGETVIMCYPNSD